MHRYVVALGSNLPHHRHGRPRGVIAAALSALADQGLAIEAASPVVTSAPLGPSRRRYANAAALVRTRLGPEELLAALKTIEHRFGRRRGRRWSARHLDLDVVLWDGGAWASQGLTIPHPAFRMRPFVTGPVRAVAPDWRDPVTGLTTRHLHARLTRPRATLR